MDDRDRWTIGPIMKATQAMHKIISRKSVADAYGGNIGNDGAATM